MLIQFWHHSFKCGEYNSGYETPKDVIEDYLDTQEKYGYDIMWGATCYNIKTVHFADNETILVVKLGRIQILGHKMKIELDSYTNEEIQIIIDKMDDLSINYKIKDNVITIIDKIDIKI